MVKVELKNLGILDAELKNVDDQMIERINAVCKEGWEPFQVVMPYDRYLPLYVFVKMKVEE